MGAIGRRDAGDGGGVVVQLLKAQQVAPAAVVAAALRVDARGVAVRFVVVQVVVVVQIVVVVVVDVVVVVVDVATAPARPSVATLRRLGHDRRPFAGHRQRRFRSASVCQPK